MNSLEKTLDTLDRWQQRHKAVGFVHAVAKRYGDDQAGYQAALLTYYAFLALFPLLLVLTTLTQVIATSHPKLQADIISSVTNNFPVLGGQLSAHVHSLHKNGLALVTGLLFVLYGARGLAAVFREGLNHIWRIPQSERPGFPASLFKNLSVLVFGGLGFIAASILTGLAATAGHALVFRALSLAVNVVVLFWLVTLLFHLSLPKRITLRKTWPAAAIAAVSLVILQTLGTFLLRRQLRDLDVLYSYFALALGLIFWIYLQAQIMYYAAEAAVVKNERLWPRSFR